MQRLCEPWQRSVTFVLYVYMMRIQHGARLTHSNTMTAVPGHDVTACCQSKVLTHCVLGCVLQGHRSFTDAVTDWYSEANGYSYGGSIGGAGHFTQIVSADLCMDAYPDMWHSFPPFM
jgi:hypothetical protein